MADFEDERNWAEDFSHENGEYQCRCTSCKNMFIGHKRRVICKLCADPTPVQGEALPVVAHVKFTGPFQSGTASSVPIFDEYGMAYRHGDKRVTDNFTAVADHAQATAEIARLQGEVQDLKDQLSDLANKMVYRGNSVEFIYQKKDAYAAQLSTALAESGEMRDSDDLRLGREIQRAAGILPDGFEVVISVENGAGTVKMFDAEGNGLDIDPDYDGFSYHVTAAIDAAVARHTTTQESADSQSK